MRAGDTTTKTARHDWRRLDAKSDAEIHEAAKRDPDARPISDAEFARARRVPLVRTIRRALGLAQEEFATRFRIPLGTLRDWEQGRAEPDQTARTYLRAIAGDAAAVLHALNTGPQPG